METALASPANVWYLFVLIPVIGISTFTFIIAKRLAPLVLSQPDPRMDSLITRTFNMFKYAIAQYRQPRYMLAGVVHIVIFAGFMIISLQSITLVMIGIKEGFTLPLMDTSLGHIYKVLKDIVATGVLVACIIAIVRRVYTKPARYAVPPKYGKEHTGEAVFVLLMISGLMLGDAFFEGSLAAAQAQKGMAVEFLLPMSIGWMAKAMLGEASISSLQSINSAAYVIHELIFFTFLCFLPLGKHFHVITSLPNVFFMKLSKGSVKPVKWGVEDDQLEELESFGVKKFEDFTWKHILDFYSCADCGRCSDQCPANAVGRPLSPRFISIKCREYSFNHYPLRDDFKASEPLIGTTLEEDEIWSCTTCGACEEECPLLIEYIDKIVDLRRGMVDDGMVPQSLQKPLNALGKRGNPYGKMEKKRADWAKALAKEEGINVKILGEDTAEVLYFVDSITSYDDSLQEIGKSTARVLTNAKVDFGILGPAEKDSGHEVRRFGEEMLFVDLKEQNTEAITESGAEKIVTADPHAMNAFMKDYNGLPPTEHISQLLAREIKSGNVRLKPAEDKDAVYVYHDPCYLGRHNEVYDEPREVIDAIPGIKRIEMMKSRDRSFCCGGGGLMLFYEPVEEKRMGQLRVEMAHEAGATVIITACPFCMVNIQDAIKTSGLEGKMEAVDLVELVERHMITE
ncbi:MAG: (Fe-S)-binding protein [Desulfobacterales bacterium]|nr:(Fe-S)-binding protein [Desulfobacterales bacterium]